MNRQGKFDGSLDSDGTADGTDGNSLDFYGTADGGNDEGLLYFGGSKDGKDGGSLDSDGITKASSMACWPRMVQPMTPLTLMAQRMALTIGSLDSETPHYYTFTVLTLIYYSFRLIN